MKRSTDRILTTHVGSLPRPNELVELAAKNEGRLEGDPAVEDCLQRSITDVVHRQADIGIDVISDGEFSKFNWQGYVMRRISGYETRQITPHRWSYIGHDLETFEDFYRESRPELFRPRNRWVCTGPLTYDDAQIKRDIANFKTALRGVNVAEAFMPVVAPGSIAPDEANEYYPTEEAYVEAIANVLRQEYRAIVDAGFLLQVDDAILANLHDQLSEHGEENYLRWCELRIEGLNHALEGIPEDRVRYHICWGSWHGPHSTDVPLRTIVNTILKAKTQAFSIEAANPRHEYEWAVWQDVKLPAGKVLIPGVVTHRTPVIEHPETVAQRLVRFASVVGRENVIASTDCGFSQGTTTQRVHPTIVWAKLQALVEGARLASQQLWK
ncbi:MAG: cobalamin-independent methionine synthase II family protein [Chloroflexi bacterium]|nr:cobalamin-independent methionine synthase II family protein [Chloroflexota bacterium]